MASGDAPIGIAVAIVPDAKSGWKALFPKAKQHKRRRQVPQQRIDKIHAELHQLYSLED